MIYAFVKINVTNPASLQSYRDKAADALARHGGAVAQASRDLVALEGQPAIPDIAAVLTFPTRDDAQAWIDDPELADVHALRRNAGSSEIIMLG